MADSHTNSDPNLIELIPDPDTVQGWLSESIRRSALLRSLLRVAQRKAAYRQNEAAKRPQEVRHAD